MDKFISGLIHIFLTIIAMALSVLIFMISHEERWVCFFNSLGFYQSYFIEKTGLNGEVFEWVFPIFIYFFLFIVLMVVCYLCILVIRFKFDKINCLERDVVNVEMANDFYLPIYLGYIFVSLSFSDFKSFILFFALIVIVLSRTRFFYFNPIFILLGYKYYFINNSDGSKILIISKKEIKNKSELFQGMQNIDLVKINEFTFMFF